MHRDLKVYRRVESIVETGKRTFKRTGNAQGRYRFLKELIGGGGGAMKRKGRVMLEERHKQCKRKYPGNVCKARGRTLVNPGILHKGGAIRNARGIHGKAREWTEST